jgi:hypothetical protein
MGAFGRTISLPLKRGFVPNGRCNIYRRPAWHAAEARGLGYPRPVGRLTSVGDNRVTMAPRPKRVVLFAVAHALLTLALSFYYTSAMTEPVLPGNMREISDRASYAGLAADILMFPGYLLWTPWASKNLPNVVEWLVFIANSALWGLVISAVVGGLSARRVGPDRARK